MRWDPADEPRIRERLEGWASTALSPGAYTLYQDALLKFHSRTVIEALQELSSEWSQQGRPPPGLVAKKCVAICERKRQSAVGAVCRWCDGSGSIPVYVLYAASARGLEDSDYCRAPRGRFLLHRGAGFLHRGDEPPVIEEVFTRLACGRCRRQRGTTVEEFDRATSGAGMGFVRFVRPEAVWRELYERILLADPPEIARYTWGEFRALARAGEIEIDSRSMVMFEREGWV